jgi:hypothetical protein
MTYAAERLLFKRLCRIVDDARAMVAGITWHQRVPQDLVPPGHKVQGVSAAWEVVPYDETAGDEVPDVSEAKCKDWIAQRQRSAKAPADPRLLELVDAVQAVEVMLRRLANDVQARELLA